MKIRNLGSVAAIVVLIMAGCEKEKKVWMEPELILSADTLVFNGVETKSLFVSSKPASEGEFQVVSYPDWVVVYPEAGTFNNDVEEIAVASLLEGREPGLYTGTMEIMSTSGSESVYLKGFVGENLLYTVPETLHFTAFDHSQTLEIVNGGNVGFSFEAAVSNDKLSLSHESGSVGLDEKGSITVLLNQDKLSSGTHQSEIYLTVNEKVDTIAVSIDFFKEEKMMVPSVVVDAEYSKSTDKLVYVTSDLKLNIYDPLTRETDHINLAFIPTCVAVSLDGTKAVVGHDAQVSYVNLHTGEVISTHNVSCKAIDIVLASNGWTYVFPEQDQHTTVRCINVEDAQPVESHHTGYSIYAGTKAKLHPSGKFMYAADNGLIPSDLEKFDIQNGTAAYLYDSPYHGDYDVRGNLWMSQDGNRIFTRSGNVFKASEIQEYDMLYNGKIRFAEDDNSYYSSTQVVGLDHSEAQNNLYIIAGNQGWESVNQPFLYVYNSYNLTFRYQIALEQYMVSDNSGGGAFYAAEPHFVFSNASGKEVYVFTRALGSGLLNEWALQTILIE